MMDANMVICASSATEGKTVKLNKNSASGTYLLDVPVLFSASNSVLIEEEILFDNNMKAKYVSYTKIDTLINFNYRLKKPFKVKITKSEDEVLGEIEELELYSFGDNEFEILRELNQNLTEMYEYLSSKKDVNLGKFPLSWKRILLSNIIK